MTWSEESGVHGGMDGWRDDGWSGDDMGGWMDRV